MLSGRIRELRHANHMSQSVFAKTIGVSKQSISNWENGNIMPSLDIIVRMAKTFHCSTDYLLGLQDENTSVFGKKLTLEQNHVLEFIANEFEAKNQQ